MIPVRPCDISAQFVDDRPILLLDTSILGIRYFSQVIISPTARITSKHGTVLPPELWERILSFAHAATSGNFCFARMECLKISSPTVQVIRCRRVELIDAPHCSDLANPEEINAFEKFLRRPGPSAVLSLNADTVQPAHSYDQKDTFDIAFTAADGALSADFSCLFGNLTVPDVISCLERGMCSMCGGDGLICPGCGTRPEDFWVSMGCGVQLACPLCIGVDYAWDHHAFLQAYYMEKAPEEGEREWDLRWDERLKELRYY